MSTEDEQGGPKRESSGLSLRLLKWLAIVLPFLFLVSLDVLRHTLLAQQLHTFPGFLGFYGVIALAVAAFSYTMFALIACLL